MIFISAATASKGSTVAIKELPKSQLKTNSARVSSFPALDGETVVVHSGTTVLDSDLKISARITREIEDKLWALFYGFTSFILVTGRECYLVTVKALKTDAGALKMDLIIISNELEA